MSDSTILLQPAYILQNRPYRESSCLIDAFTLDYGRISLIAKGVRKSNSRTAALLRPFNRLSLTFTGKSDLKTLTAVELPGQPIILSGLALYCGFYLNELVSLFLHKEDPHPEVFQNYQQSLRMLTNNTQIETALRMFELDLLDNVGYGVNLNYDLHNKKPVALNKKYLFNKTLGIYEDVEGVFSGYSLLAMEQRNFDLPQTLSEAKQLMRAVIDTHLHGKPLKSRLVMNAIFKRL